MNSKLSYEILLTEKLEARPVPDLADAIWARIEAQLDIDLPGDEPTDGNSAPKAPTSGKWWLGFGLSVFIVALILAFLQQKSDAELPGPLPQNSIESSPTLVPKDAPPDIGLPTSPSGDVRPLKPSSPGTAGTLDDSASTPGDPDNLILPTITPTLPDSQFLKPGPSDKPTANPPRQDTIRKPRGVKGITDDDYRIEPGGRGN